MFDLVLSFNEESLFEVSAVDLKIFQSVSMFFLGSLPSCWLNFSRLHSSVLNLLKIEVGRYMGVSKNRGTLKWMVYNGKPYQNG